MESGDRMLNEDAAKESPFVGARTRFSPAAVEPGRKSLRSQGSVGRQMMAQRKYQLTMAGSICS